MAFHSLCMWSVHLGIILEEAGVPNREATATYSIGATQIFAILMSAILIDRAGTCRKPLGGGLEQESEVLFLEHISILLNTVCAR